LKPSCVYCVSSLGKMSSSSTTGGTTTSTLLLAELQQQFGSGQLPLQEGSAGAAAAENVIWGDYGNNPLVMSLLAGLSTCLGATVAFCSSGGGGQRKLGHAHLAFSLSLAGSVMITVSIASILPECFQLEEDNDGLTRSTRDGAAATTNAVGYLGPAEWQFWARWMAFGIGCGLYMMLSRCAFPEPEHLLGLEQQPSSTIFEDAAATTAATSSSAGQIISPLRDNDGRSKRVSDADTDSHSPLLSPSNISSRTTVQRKFFSSSLKNSGSRSNLENDGDDVDGDTIYNSKTGKSSEAKRAWRVTMLLFVSLMVHNFPEGLAVAASSLHSNKLGWTTTVAIALHNIPEGIAIAIPCLAARPDSPWLAFFLASLSGLAEPLGAAVAVFFLQGDGGWLNQADNMKNVLAFVAGVMIMVASIELFPEARRHMTESKVPGVAGTLAGIVIMLSSDAYLDS
jgi:zinc transporter, ZIP family